MLLPRPLRRQLAKLLRRLAPLMPACCLSCWRLLLLRRRLLLLRWRLLLLLRQRLL